MKPTRRVASTAGLLAAAGLVASLGTSALFVSAADHLDAPTTKTAQRIDITDLYAFKSSGGTTLILNTNPLTSPGDTATTRFRGMAIYQFQIDTDGDAKAEIAYRVKFRNRSTLKDGSVIQDFVVMRDTGKSADRNGWYGEVVASGQTTAYGHKQKIVKIDGGGKVFAGPRDDPFFFDLPGFVQFKTELLAGNTDLGDLLGGFTGEDTFRGTNVTSLAIELPNKRLGGGGTTVGVWATTLRRSGSHWRQIDRMGRPAINTVFNTTDAEKEGANRIKPTADRAYDRDNVIGVLGAIGNVLDANSLPAYDDATISGIADVLLPDLLTIKLGDSAGFLNGRKLGDDVIDAEFGLLTNGNVTSDGVDANDRSFRTHFPYIQKPF
jgi:Domain of unknown function (DUF4331)